MPCNDPKHKDEFLAWLRARIERNGFTVEDVPDYMGLAYRSGNSKDLNPVIWREWFNHYEATINPKPSLGHPDYFTGPRGGRYRINSNGRKSYDVP